MLEILVSPYRGLSKSSKFFKVPKEAWEETLEIFPRMSLMRGGGVTDLRITVGGKKLP